MEPERKTVKFVTSFKGASLTSLGWELALPIFGGVFIGYRIDQYIGTNYIFTLLFLFIGIATGYYSIFKYIQLEMLKTKLKKEQEQNEKRAS